MDITDDNVEGKWLREIKLENIYSKHKYMNIYSKHPEGYQMDTFINNKRKNEFNYLMFINVNTCKAYSYPLVGKGAKTIIEAFNKYIDDVYSLACLLFLPRLTSIFCRFSDDFDLDNDLMIGV